MAEMAILQNVDKCMRCNGCVISCKRTHNMKATSEADPANLIHRVALDQRVTIKSQKQLDMGPFVRYSCWHCSSPPCAVRCPVKAVKRDTNTGAVYIDHELCNPSVCNKQCAYDCGRGGYPKVGVGSTKYTTSKSYKCTMCHDPIDDPENPGNTITKLSLLPTKGTAANTPWYLPARSAQPNEPACVFTCPAQALVYDTKANIAAHIAAGGYLSKLGDGHIYWVSKKNLLIAPKADPFIEDHVSPLVSKMLESPFAKAALVPTLVAGGLLAMSARRAHNEAETV